MADSKRNLDILLAELIDELRHQHETHTELTAQLRGLIANDVLLVGTYPIPTSGYLTFDFPASYGSVQLTNHGATNDMTITADTPQDVAPSGRGAYRVKAATVGPWVVLHGRALTIYGTAGDRASFQITTRPST